jgi:hypothetical protein
MNYARIALATLGATVVYFILGGLLFGLSPLADEFRKFPAVFRTPDDMKTVIPIGIFGMILSMLVLTVLYSLLYREGSGIAQGARFGALIGAFAVGSFVLHNYVNLNIGLKLTIEQAAAYLVQWIVVGIVIGLIYKTSSAP